MEQGKKFVIWTPDEVEALIKELVIWCKARQLRIDEEHYKVVIQMAACTTLGWRPRKLQAHAARDFIAKHKVRIHDLCFGEMTYRVPCYSEPMTVPQMIETLVKLEDECFNSMISHVQALDRIEELERLLAEKEAKPEPVTVTVESPRFKPEKITFTPTLRPKVRVAIAGVHDKHRDRIAHEFPHLMITWIEPRDNDAQIKAKASSKPCIACTHGTNGKVLKLLHNISTKCWDVGGASGVRDILASQPLQ